MISEQTVTNGELAEHFRQQVVNEIETKFILISQQNEKKRRNFIVS